MKTKVLIVLKIVLALNLSFFFSCTNELDLIIEDVVVEEINLAEEEAGNNEGDDNTNFGEIEIATWYNFREAAITHTWDDSSTGHIEIVIPLFDLFNFNTTLFSLPNNIDDWSLYRQAHNRGHEIASHTVTHSSFSEISPEAIEQELKNSQELINQGMGSSDCHTFAYPFCSTESYGLTQKYYIGARTCDGRVEESTPTDYMKISSIICGGAPQNSTSNDFNNIAVSALEKNGWAIYLFHDIDGSGQYAITSQNVKEHLEYLSNNSQIYWVDTFLNVIKYAKERDAIEINPIEITDLSISFNFKDSLPDLIFNFPLTLKKEIPFSWQLSGITLMQGNQELIFDYIENDTKKYILFNAIPDKGIIEIDYAN